jgi:hypothetical protein
VSSNYPVGILELRLLITPLVSSDYPVGIFKHFLQDKTIIKQLKRTLVQTPHTRITLLEDA